MNPLFADTGVKRGGRSVLLAALCALSACGAPAPEPSVPQEPSAAVPATPAAPAAAETTAPAAQPAPSPAPAAAVDDALGGRLFDRWYTGKDFTPDSAKTPDAIDGRGGPFGNGSLPRADGAPWSNASGHDYRLKNLFGWDLRGSEGIAGPKYQNKKQVLAKNLLAGKESFDELLAWFDKGSTDSPGLGKVLSQDELRSLTSFVIGVRDGKLPHPDQVWTLSTTSPGRYTLNAGGDATRGARLIGERCARCHGADGTAMLFDDDEFSLGTHTRQKAYEDWAKILNGQPGTKMGRQVKSTTGKEMAQEILDIFAALCDRKAFPKGAAKAADVPDKDVRCGAYLR